jgi:hypothetical protein
MDQERRKRRKKKEENEILAKNLDDTQTTTHLSSIGFRYHSTALFFSAI